MQPLHILLAILVTMIWGCNFLVSKYGMGHFPPFLFSALRFSVVALVLVPFAARPQPGQWRKIFQLSVVLGTGHLALVICGMHYGLDIATSVITTQLSAPLACLLSAIFLKDYLGPWRSFGLLVAFLGIFGVAGTPNVADNFGAFLLVLFGALNFGFASILMKQMKGIPTFTVLGWMALMAAPQIFLISLFEESHQLELVLQAPWWAWMAVSYSAFLSSIVAYGLWYWLFSKYDVSQITPFTLLVPVFGIAGGALVYGETLATQTLIGGAVTILGVGIIILRRPRTASAPQN